MLWSRRGPTGPADVAQATDSGDPFGLYVPQWTAFLGQARWLLEQQQARGARFQETAVAVVGFDGVLLAVLVSGDALSHLPRQGLAWWSAIVGSTLLVLSSLAGVMSIKPRATNAVGASDTLNAWAELKEYGSWDRANQHFAEMLLNPSPRNEEPASPRERRAARWRGRLRVPGPPAQPLLAAAHLAGVRGRWAARSAGLLVVGLGCLAVAMIVAP